MPIITEKILKVLKEKDLSRYKLSKLIDYPESSLNGAINGKFSFSLNLMKKVSKVLKISVEEMQGWVLADKYDKNTLELALSAKIKHAKSQKFVFTLEIDERLQEKELSRTRLSKVINYSQGVLNEMIIGKHPISKTVIQKIAPIIEVSEDEIQAWIVAHKYSLEAIKVAISCKD